MASAGSHQEESMATFKSLLEKGQSCAKGGKPLQGWGPGSRCLVAARDISPGETVLRLQDDVFPIDPEMFGGNRVAAAAATVAQRFDSWGVWHPELGEMTPTEAMAILGDTPCPTALFSDGGLKIAAMAAQSAVPLDGWVARDVIVPGVSPGAGPADVSAMYRPGDEERRPALLLKAKSIHPSVQPTIVPAKPVLGPLLVSPVVFAIQRSDAQWTRHVRECPPPGVGVPPTGAKDPEFCQPNVSVAAVWWPCTTDPDGTVETRKENGHPVFRETTNPMLEVRAIAPIRAGEPLVQFMNYGGFETRLRPAISSALEAYRVDLKNRASKSVITGLNAYLKFMYQTQDTPCPFMVRALTLASKSGPLTTTVSSVGLIGTGAGGGPPNLEIGQPDTSDVGPVLAEAIPPHEIPDREFVQAMTFQTAIAVAGVAMKKKMLKACTGKEDLAVPRPSPELAKAAQGMLEEYALRAASMSTFRALVNAARNASTVTDLWMSEEDWNGGKAALRQAVYMSTEVVRRRAVNPMSHAQAIDELLKLADAASRGGLGTHEPSNPTVMSALDPCLTMSFATARTKTLETHMRVATKALGLRRVDAAVDPSDSSRVGVILSPAADVDPTDLSEVPDPEFGPVGILPAMEALATHAGNTQMISTKDSGQDGSAEFSESGPGARMRLFRSTMAWA